jgi:phytoene dehydrogenase-like protein
MPPLDAIVVGSGPNGLAAAIVLAATGRAVLVREAQATLGGGARTLPLTLPGFLHDHCSAVHPLARASPFFRTLPLEARGLRWIDPPSPLAHPFDDGRALTLERSLDATAELLGRDGTPWKRLFAPLVARWDAFLSAVLGPPRLGPHPTVLARFGLDALRSAASLARSRFEGAEARALFAGLAAHAMLPLERAATASFGLVLGASAHAAGWPLPEGGAQRIADALAEHLLSLGGRIEHSAPVASLSDLPSARAVLCDVTPRQLLSLAKGELSAREQRALSRFRYGVGAFKLDWALSEPIPWRAPQCRRAATVHLGGTLEEIAEAERAPWEGRAHPRPFVLLVQPTLFDPSRAPVGRHTAWAYCHVPHGFEGSATGAIEAQVERFAPGFRDCVLARSAKGPRELERDNANLVGGDVNGGAQDLPQLFTRPTWRLYSTSKRGLYLCSASTPPGGGVHGMCGYFAAQRALREVFR